MPTKAERQTLARQKRAEERLVKHTKLTRRNFLLRLGLSAAGLGIAGVSLSIVAANFQKMNDESTSLPPLDPSKYEVNPILLTPALPARPGSRSYSVVGNSELKQMWNEAKTPTTLDALQKLATMPQHVSVIFSELASKKTGRGTALMIDQSGLFLTARHVITDEKSQPAQAGLVYHPGLNQTFPVSQMIFSPDGDLGLVYAPTGLARGKASGVQIATEEINQGMLLRQYGTMFDKGSVWLAQMEGTALGSDFKPFPRYSFKGLRAVYGMVPFGGSSGGPIVSIETGAVMAVESGLIANKGTINMDRNNYIGSTVAPVIDMDAVIRNQQLHKL